MNKSTNYILMAAGFAILVAVVSGITAAPAIAAAVKAALVENVDEPGRVPFSQEAISSCNSFNCVSSFAVVPTGQRLVIEHIGGLVRPNSTATVVQLAELITSDTTTPLTAVVNDFPMTLVATPGASNVANTWGFNQPVKAYVNAGSYPTVTMYQQNQGTVFYAEVTISGYMVNLTY